VKPEAPTHDELAEWLGYEPNQKAAIRRWLDRNGIPYRLGKDGVICTTWTAVNSRLVDGRQGLRLA